MRNIFEKINLESTIAKTIKTIILTLLLIGCHKSSDLKMTPVTDKKDFFQSIEEGGDPGLIQLYGRAFQIDNFQLSRSINEIVYEKLPDSLSPIVNINIKTGKDIQGNSKALSKNTIEFSPLDQVNVTLNSISQKSLSISCGNKQNIIEKFYQSTPIDFETIELFENSSLSQTDFEKGKYKYIFICDSDLTFEKDLFLHIQSEILFLSNSSLRFLASFGITEINAHQFNLQGKNLIELYTEPSKFPSLLENYGELKVGANSIIGEGELKIQALGANAIN